MTSEELKAAAQSLKILFNSFPTAGPVDVDGQVEAYLWAVKDYHVADLQQAVYRFVQGEVADFSGAFCPSTAQLCQEVRYRAEIRVLKAAKSNVVTLPPRPPKTAFLRKHHQGEK